jgi:hypothetical protein
VTLGGAEEGAPAQARAALDVSHVECHEKTSVEITGWGKDATFCPENRAIKLIANDSQLG